jgi:hypothetical protein
VVIVVDAQKVSRGARPASWLRSNGQVDSVLGRPVRIGLRKAANAHDARKHSEGHPIPDKEWNHGQEPNQNPGKWRQAQRGEQGVCRDSRQAPRRVDPVATKRRPQSKLLAHQTAHHYKENDHEPEECKGGTDQANQLPNGIGVISPRIVISARKVQVCQTELLRISDQEKKRRGKNRKSALQAFRNATRIMPSPRSRKLAIRSRFFR